MFNFWPFNVARKRRERQEAEAYTQQIADSAAKVEAALRARLAELKEMARTSRYDPTAPKRNKVIPMDDPRHPRNLSPQQRADRLAALRGEAEAMFARAEKDRPPFVYQGSQRQTFSGGPRVVHNLPKVTGVDYATEAVAQVQQFRCTHPAISEFWQEQQKRCDSPTDTGSPICDVSPSSDN